MTALGFKLVGGIGLFLMGMVLLTDGLKALAGDALRRALVRFTGTPARAFASGALITAMVQSSSATTVAVIGFVSAGLLTFPQAVGVVMGASLGTTGTGWIVSILGLKVSLGFYALPLVGAGAFLKLLGHGRARLLGLALAGFGLIFVGIETLQDALRGLAGVFPFTRLPAGGLGGHLVAMLIGIVMTVLMQSSSAAVATTLTALHAGAILFDQAASLVIGAAVGTTVTGVLAAIGGTVSAKRTALAHVLFNLATGLIAVALLPLFLRGIGWAQAHLGLGAGAISLAAFHTAFIASGAAIFLPFIRPFAACIERWLPERGPALTRHLDDTVLHAPTVALEATRRALSEVAGEWFQTLLAFLDGDSPARAETRGPSIRAAREQVQEFLARIPPLAGDEPLSHSRVAQMHAMDHVVRLEGHWPPEPGVQRALRAPRLQPLVARTRALLELAVAGFQGRAPADWVTHLEQQSTQLAELRRAARPEVFRQTAEGTENPAGALEILDAMRWLDRVGYHTWRIANYLGGEGRPEPQPRD